MAAYYNEIDPYAAQWLRNLIAAGHIPDGDVDERSIADVEPIDLVGYTQCHFFAGIGGWGLAARLALWGDDRPLWTGSCPCQPFSVAGKGAGQADARHLWPELARLVGACRPPVLVGEQVAAAVGKSWLDGVRSDLEGLDYAVRGVVIPACAVDAPHRRDRLWFVADATATGREARGGDGLRADARSIEGSPARLGGPASVADADGARSQVLPRQPGDARAECAAAVGDGWGGAGAMGDTDELGAGEERQQRGGELGGAGGDPSARDGDVADASHAESARFGQQLIDVPEQADRGAWAGAGWLTGADGKARRVEPGICLLAHGVPARVSKLRAFGNAIVPQVAAEILRAI